VPDPLRTNGGWHPTTRAAGVRQVFTGKKAALARAIAATPIQDHGMRVWLSADAAFIDGRWVCLLEDNSTVYVVHVHPHTEGSWVAVRGASG
jgi:hypothetical protein